VIEMDRGDLTVLVLIVFIVGIVGAIIYVGVSQQASSSSYITSIAPGSSSVLSVSGGALSISLPPSLISTVSLPLQIFGSNLFLNSLILTHSNITGQLLANQIPNLSISHSNITDWGTATSGFLTSSTQTVQSVTSANGLSLSTGTLSYTQQSITHSQISDWDSATSGFLTTSTQYIRSVNGSGLLVTVGGVLECIDVNQGVLTTSTPLFSGLTIQNVANVSSLIETTGNTVALLKIQRAQSSGSYNQLWSIGLLASSTVLNFGVINGNSVNQLMSLSSSGNLIATGTVTGSLGVISDYLSGAYGATWGSLPSMPTGTNGMMIVLYNTSTSTARIYVYANGAWQTDLV